MTNKDVVINLFTSLSEEQKNFRYEVGKWSPHEMLGHLTDTERIFGFRALCIARGEKQSLPGFDENEYADAAKFSEVSFESLLNQYSLVRESSLALFTTFTDEVASQIGNANGNAVSAKALIWMIAGHEIHHLGILKDKYGIS